MGVICLHCFVSGRVQGVFFRRHAMDKAIAEGVKGYARNLADGRVEVMICGEEPVVRAMESWLWQGPPAASVTEVQSTEIPWQDFSHFEVR